MYFESFRLILREIFPKEGNEKYFPVTCIQLSVTKFCYIFMM